MKTIAILMLCAATCAAESFNSATDWAQAQHHYCVAIGRRAVTTTNNQLVIAADGGTITATITTGEWAALYSILCRATETPRESDWFDRVFDAICHTEDASGEYAGRVHHDGVSYGRCGITQVAVQDCIDNGYLPPGVYDLSDPAMADWCGRQYLRLLVARWGSLWDAVCHWNKGRKAYAAKVWARLSEEQ